MIYFDNAATGGQKPENVLFAVRSALKINANPGRSGHKLSLFYAKKVFETRELMANYFSAESPERVIFTKNCTEALNLLLFGTLQKGDHVITTALEHNSVLRPLHFLEKQGVITLSVCPLKDGQLDLNDLKNLLTDSTKAVVMTSASNVTGYVPPFEKVRSVLPENVFLFLDGAQGGGHIPIKLTDYGIDAVALAGHKGLCGIQGSGALIFGERVEVEPTFFGGTGSESYSLDAPDFYPDRLETGTVSYPAILSLNEGIKYLIREGEQNTKTLLALTDYLCKKLSQTSYQVYSTKNPVGIVAFSHPTLSSEQVATLLSENYDIAVRGGLHCAPFMHKALSTDPSGLVRVSFSAFNTVAEIDKLLYGLKRIESIR